jgi:hypothetical protein
LRPIKEKEDVVAKEKKATETQVKITDTTKNGDAAV